MFDLTLSRLRCKGELRYLLDITICAAIRNMYVIQVHVHVMYVDERTSSISYTMYVFFIASQSAGGFYHLVDGIRSIVYIYGTSFNAKQKRKQRRKNFVSKQNFSNVSLRKGEAKRLKKLARDCEFIAIAGLEQQQQGQGHR